MSKAIRPKDATNAEKYRFAIKAINRLLAGHTDGQVELSFDTIFGCMNQSYGHKIMIDGYPRNDVWGWIAQFFEQSGWAVMVLWTTKSLRIEKKTPRHNKNDQGEMRRMSWYCPASYCE